MKVILLQNIKGLGRIGDVKNVADGYGRNYLLVDKLVKLATKENLKEVEGLKKKAEAELKVAQDRASEFAEKAKDTVLEFTKKSSKTGTLFASITKQEVAESLSGVIGGKIEPSMVDLKEHGEHIKREGEHIIEVKLAPEVKVEIKVVVNPHT